MAKPKNKIFSGRKPPRRKSGAASRAAEQNAQKKQREEIRKGVNRINSNIQRVKDIGGSLKSDILGTLMINFSDYMTPSGYISKKIAKSDDPSVLARIDSMNDFIKAKIEEYKNIPEDIYDMWQACIDEYFAFVSEVGLDAMKQLAPLTSANILTVSKTNGSDNPQYLDAVRTWRAERKKVIDYIMHMSNNIAFTDEDFE